MNLSHFKIAKAPEIARLRAHPLPPPLQTPRPRFLAPRSGAERIRVIAEYKRASPSRGVIREDLTPEQIAEAYTDGGASAISVLTEEIYFKGQLDFLRRVAAQTALPLLRKDFIFDEAQVRETASTPASALLLIVALTPDPSHLRDLRLLTESFGMTAVVEVFDERELEIARAAGASVIQVNNRNLETLAVDASVTTRLVSRKMADEIWIAASGYETRQQLDALRLAGDGIAPPFGYDAALVGTALMASENPRETLREMTENRKVSEGVERCREDSTPHDTSRHLSTPPEKTLIKICGITRACDAAACEARGVDFCGFVFHAASPRNMTAAAVADIRTGGGIKRVGVFTTHDIDEILRTMETARLDYAQLHAEQSEACAEAIGAGRVIRVCFALPERDHPARNSGHPSAGGELCAAFLLFDKPFDWHGLKGRDVRQPYFIAGGLNAQNIREALACCAPAGVDLNSGVESAPGVKDVQRIDEVLKMLRLKPTKLD